MTVIILMFVAALFNEKELVSNNKSLKDFLYIKFIYNSYEEHFVNIIYVAISFNLRILFFIKVLTGIEAIHIFCLHGTL